MNIGVKCRCRAYGMKGRAMKKTISFALLIVSMLVLMAGCTSDWQNMAIPPQNASRSSTPASSVSNQSADINSILDYSSQIPSNSAFIETVETAFPDMPGVTVEWPAEVERPSKLDQNGDANSSHVPILTWYKLLEETSTEKTYVVITTIRECRGSDSMGNGLGFLSYTISIPASLYLGEYGIVYLPSETQDISWCRLDSATLSIDDYTLADYILPQEEPVDGIDYIAHGAMPLESGYTLYYNYYHYNWEASTNRYQAAIDFGGGIAVHISFFAVENITPVEWDNQEIYESIMATVQPYEWGS